MSKEELFVLVYKGPNSQSSSYIVDLNNSGNRDWFLSKIGVNDKISEIGKRIDSLQRARFQLQRAEVAQLTANLKPEMLSFIEKTYPDKAFKEWPVRDEFDDWYGWQACVTAFQELVAEGKITYKRGWNRLAKPVIQDTSKEKQTGEQ